MRRIYIILFLFTACVAAWAQSIVVDAPSQVAVGEQFRLSYSINTQDVQGFRAGNIPEGLEVLMGPTRSSRTSIQMINGHTSGSSSITYTYVVYAEKPGTYTIQAARAKVNGKDAVSQPVKIKVSGTAQSSQGGSRYQQQPGAQVRSAGSHISGNDLFIKVTANKTRVHEQEPVLLTYKVYTQLELTQLEGKMPDLNGFHTQEVELPQQKSFHLENVNGKPYRCVTWSQYVMYPQKTGKLQIPDITFKGIVVQENANVDPLEAFLNGGSGYVEVKRDIVAKGVTIQVDPLPAKPAGFSGGVGKFTLSGQMMQQEVKANDAVTLRLVVSGNGNLKLLKQPEVQWPKDFDKYDPKVTDKTKLMAAGLEGNIIYDCLAAPRNAGEYEIPTVTFTYFDTSEGTYKTLTAGPFKITVTPSDNSGSSSDAKASPLDIRDIKKGNDASLASDNFYGTGIYWFIIALTFVAFVLLIVIFRKRAIERADIVKMRGKKANKVAVKRLKRAAQLMKEQKQSEFYDEVLRALWGYIGDKLNIPVSELSRENITEQLLSRNVDEMDVSTFVNAIDECEYARYAPGEALGKMNIVYEKAIRGITDVDNFLMGKKKNSTAMKGMSAAKILVIILSLINGTSAFALSKAEADAAYEQKNFVKAIADYKLLIHQQPTAELYYNLGNAYYRTDSLPQAILAYERALKINPSDEDVLANLRFVRSKTIDKMQPDANIFVVSWWNSIVNIFSPTVWAVIAILLLVMVVGLLLIYLFVEAMWARQIGFFGGIALLVLFVLCNIFGWQQTNAMESGSGAIVTVASCSVMKTPDAQGTNECVIHEATHVVITDDSVKGWYEVLLDDGRSGWIDAKSVEKI